jgi:hypothetical protein
MVEYVVKLSKDATQIRAGRPQPAAPRRLRRHSHFAITLIASWFNYINRVADALGVGRQ